MSSSPPRLLAVAELARHLGVLSSILSRALHDDPDAPAPAERDDVGRQLYALDDVTAWWPTRRRPRPLTVAELARHLGVLPSTLSRALRNDPSAPAPAERNDVGRPLYALDDVTAWWPTRRRRGKPHRAPNPADSVDNTR